MKDDQLDSQLENELRSLRPTKLSNDFRTRLRERLEPATFILASDRPWRTPFVRRLMVLATMAAVVFLCWLAWNWPRDTGSFRADQIPSHSHEKKPAPTYPSPTLIALNKSLNDPQIPLEDLLDYHSQTILPHVRDPIAPVYRR